MYVSLASAAVAAVTSLTDVQACLPRPDGRTLAATTGGLVLVDRAGRVERVLTALDGLGGTAAYALAAGDGGRVWVGTEGGLAELDGTKVVRTLPARPVRAILPHAGDLYVATWGGGLLALRGDTLAPLGAPASGTSLAWSDEGLVMGTAGDGVLRLEAAAGAPTLRPLAVNAALPSRMVFGLVVHDGALLVGTVTGLAEVRGARVRTLDGHDTRALWSDGGPLLTGSYGAGRSVNGVARAHGRTCIAARDGLSVDGREAALGGGPPSNDVAALLARADGVWIGTFDRGLVVRRGDGRVDPVAGVDARVNALLDGGDAVWVATARGLSRVDPKTLRETRRLTSADGLPADEVHALARGAAGALVAGTARGAAIIRGDRVEVIDRKRGLEGDAVWAIAAQGDALWLGTSRGVFRWQPGRRRLERFATATGHLDEDWVTALAVDPSGAGVWVGTYAKGVTHLAPAGRTFAGTSLGGGAVNVGGLAWIAGKLHVATMDGLLVRGDDEPWAPVAQAAPGKDVTAVAARDGTVWVASRRGLARH